MLKQWSSPYVAGRPKGPWFKWKRDPLTADCVLMYAQRGHGKRSSFYSDYTFGCWRDGGDGATGAGELVPVGKAYSGFTDAELVELDRWVRRHTVDRFGPVRVGRAGPGARDRVRRGAVLDAAQIGRRDALPAGPPDPLGQAGSRGRPAGAACHPDRGRGVRRREGWREFD